jgi:phenylpropionate dioxygenase-like ring-hydroxylating dioxygenase large terminal subunit
MLTKQENDLLTLTGPGTPAGKLIRRYWQPAGLSEELPPGGAPLPVRLLGEDLVLFRDDQGRTGLLGLHCSHRGADLSYGRVEDGGLRCIYHGWLYDVHGRCLEQPGEPARPIADSGLPNAESIRNPHSAIKHLAYPCVERNGLILAYLGPGEAPLPPNYEFFTVPPDHAAATKLYSECNYLQGNEGNIDLLHTSFLHYVRRDLPSLSEEERRAVVERYEAPESLSGRGPSAGLERCEAQMIPHGLRICKIRDAGQGREYVRLATFLLPNLTVIPGGGINWHVPIDDTHHWKYVLSFNRDQPIPRRPDRAELAPAPDYRPVAHRGNRYLQDRASMTTLSYCGVPQQYFAAQDTCATEGAGPIQDRTHEQLAASDAPIAAARNILRKAILDVQEGAEPPHIVRDPERNAFPEIVAGYGLLPEGMTWREYSAQLVAEGRGWQTRPFPA